MNIIQKIHDDIDHDHKESCNLYELIGKVLELDSWYKADEALQDMFGNAEHS